ncbi:hypothetical protein JA1_002607 [Spathaspora sp. JA1]|nr:hypothetical protein JA1_002607 [Spathaspora sp. JA1]
MKLQSFTLLSLAASTLAVNLGPMKLINQDELIIQQFEYPAIVALNEQADQFEETRKKDHKKGKKAHKKGDKKNHKKEKTTTLTPVPSTSTPKISITKTTSKTSSSETTTATTSSKKEKSTSKTSSHTASITKTNGGDSIALSIGGPVALALGLLL